jgi:putative aminopeptidase FrvX
VTLLGLAHTLSTQQYLLEAAHVRVMLAFTDQEEGIPEAYFGHGAARLTHYLPQPTLGCMVADGQTVQAEGPLVSQAGSGHGVVSAWSRGTVVPPNYVALAEDLAASVNAIYPRTVQINHGYLSRSDDMALGRWAPILGMIGPPMTGAHTAEEAAYMTDLQAAIRWISHYAVAALGLSTEMREAYTLGAGGK